MRGKTPRKTTCHIAKTQMKNRFSDTISQARLPNQFPRQLSKG
ncbi:hypothetical protein SLEP1_g15785 [Rubroshorea leprosula]|uniref:Ribosomal protein S18 n=1 Tax=Rubroshorea leprosula TaxID=152421 RepID=A0AAV5IXH1_9ROSI|nr:hypothetical protein SLEP1_g15785 [Rubroshorea leprosula]